MTRNSRAVRWVVIGVVAAAVTCGGALAVLLGPGAVRREATRAGTLRSASLPSGNLRTFDTRDSVRLNGVQLVVQSRGTVILVHGLAEPDSLFNQWALALNAASSMNVIGVALRGNGTSRDSIGRGDAAEHFAIDLGGAIKELKRRQPSGPVILLASHGGLGVTAAYERLRSTMGLPAPDGIIAMEVDTAGTMRVANGRPLLLMSRRLRTLEALRAAGVTVGEGLDVASQESSGRELTTRWSFRAWQAAQPRLESLLDAQRTTGTPMLVVSARREPITPTAGSDRTWEVVPPPVDPNAPAVVAAITRWSTMFAADAYDPVPPKATRTLEVLPVK